MKFGAEEYNWVDDLKRNLLSSIAAPSFVLSNILKKGLCVLSSLGVVFHISWIRYEQTATWDVQRDAQNKAILPKTA